MSDLENHIRSFGMSGYQITSDIREVEQAFQLDLGHFDSDAASSTADYYPQFEMRVRTEASEMAAHYEVFYCLEKSIRALISETMEELLGANWWDAGKVDAKIAGDTVKRIQREIDSGVTRRSSDKLDYINFSELSVIITSNWDIFGAIFNSKLAVERVLSNLNTLRGPIAHCSKLSEDEVTRLRLSVRDWFRTMQ